MRPSPSKSQAYSTLLVILTPGIIVFTLEENQTFSHTSTTFFGMFSVIRGRYIFPLELSITRGDCPLTRFQAIYFSSIIIFNNNSEIIFFCNIRENKSNLILLCNLNILRFRIRFSFIIPDIWGNNTIRIYSTICLNFYKYFLRILFTTIYRIGNTGEFWGLIF